MPLEKGAGLGEATHGCEYDAGAQCVEYCEYREHREYREYLCILAEHSQVEAVRTVDQCSEPGVDLVERRYSQRVSVHSREGQVGVALVLAVAA